VKAAFTRSAKASMSAPSFMSSHRNTNSSP
jgi:hypothetical protein